VANPDRLTGLDSSFLHLERDSAHMHVAGVAIFKGSAPEYDELVQAIVGRLHLVPRYRQRLAFVPLQQGRPVWVDDPHFNPAFHVRHTALPKPGGDDELKRLAGRVFSQALDRSKPLWELWLVEGLDDDRFALLTKTHHALVDGVSGVDIATVLFDTAPDPLPVAPAEQEWVPRPLPTEAQLLADALLERATVPGEIVRGVRHALRGPRQVADRVGEALVGVGAMAWAGLNPAPPSPLNVPIGPHRRFTWVRGDLAHFKAIKNALGGTVNDVVLAAVTGAVGAQILTELTGFAPPTIVAQAARIQARQRFFNLVVTNVPGPQFPLYLLGRELDGLFPMVPLAKNQALGIAIMSYNGQLNFGLNADYDAMADLETLADELRSSIEELSAAAGEPAADARAPARSSAAPTVAGVAQNHD
jgi:hypothetical protein